MKLFKKDFKAIATIIKESNNKNEIALKISKFLETTNKQFNKEKFLKACS